MKNLADLQDIFSKALDLFIKRDWHLIEVDCHEQNVTHHIAKYLEQLIGDRAHIDCEYNRIEEKVKKHGRPDIVIHQRGRNENFLVVEAKYLGQSNESDRAKVRSFIEDPEYRYSFGLLLTIPSKEKKQFTLEWWQRSTDGTAAKI